MKKFFLTYHKIFLRTGFLLQGLLMLSGNAHAKIHSTDTVGLYIAPTATLYVNDKSQISINSNVINDGVFGSVKGVTINMFGEKWRNNPGASLPDEFGINSFAGVGGIFRFVNTTLPQYISGGFSIAGGRSGASFPAVTVANSRGVFLENNDAQIRNTLQFEDGILFLNENSLLIGTSNPGTITGYTENRFVATGNTNKGGFLYRAKISGSAGNVVFPVGPQAGSYAPLSIMFNAATAQDLHVRVFDDIYRNAFQGTKGSSASVQQTWNLGQENTTAVPSILAIQHNITREGSAFTTHRGNSYISRYDFLERAWDTTGPTGITSPGSLTTGARKTNTYINTRVFDSLGQTVYLNKTADIKSDSLVIAKAALTPVRQVDGSFAVTFVFVVKNLSTLPARALQVHDSLALVFKSSMSFTVGTVTTSGKLVANSGFDGVTATDLLLPASTLAPLTSDTITLVMNVISDRQEAYYYNIATLKGIIDGFNGTQYAIRTRSVNGLQLPAPGAIAIPTPLVLTASKYVMPQGFSPNGDGVNDLFVIGRVENAKVALWIFDKRGVYVYKNMNYKNDWDGTNNQNVGGAQSGQKIADGTYFYKAIITDQATGNAETYNGFLSIWK